MAAEKNDIEHLSKMLGSAFPSDFCLTCDSIGRSEMAGLGLKKIGATSSQCHGRGF